MYGHITQCNVLILIAKKRIHAIDGSQGAQDGAVVNRFGRFVVACYDYQWYARSGEPAQLFQPEGKRPVGRAGPVEKVAGMDDCFRLEFQNPIDYPFKGVIYILLAGIDAIAADPVVCLITQVGVGKMDKHGVLQGNCY